MKIKILLFATFLVISLNSAGQSEYRDGYIISSQNDTITGLIDYRGDVYNSKQCRFKPSLNENYIDYTPNDVSAYRFTNSKLYVSKEIKIENKTKTYFLECLIKGKLTVYFLRHSDGNDYYFIETDSGLKLAENNERIITNEFGDEYFKKSNQYKGVFRYYLQDLKELLHEVENLRYDRDAIIRLSKEYHEITCKDEDCIIYEKVFPDKSYLFGLSVIWGNYSFKYGKEYSNFEGEISPFWALTANIKTSLSRTNERVHLELQLAYEKMEAKGSNTLNSNISTYSFDISGIKLRAGFSYIYPVYSIKPILSAGTFIEHLNFSNYEYKFNNNILPFNSSIDNYNGFGFYFLGGIEYNEHLRIAISYEINNKKSDMEYFYKSGFEYSLTYFF